MTDGHHRRTALVATPLFAAASAASLNRLAAASIERRLRRGTNLFIEGDVPRSVWLVLEGSLRVFVTSLDGDEPTLGLLTAGDLVGELGVLGGIRRSASVAAVQPSRVLEIPGAVFREVYESDPAPARQLVDLLSRRLRATSGTLADLTLLDLGARLAKFLLAEAHRCGSHRFTLPHTQADLGRMLGGARQTVNQVLHSFEHDGFITIAGRSVELIDIDGLRRRSMSSA